MTVAGKTAKPGADHSVEGLIAITGALIAVMDRETALLAEMRPKEIAALQEQKARLVRGYEERARLLRGDRARLAAVGQAARAELRTTVDRFLRAAAANAKALKASREANERLLKAIVDAAADSQADAPGYARDGALRGDANRGSKGVSLTLNQEL